MACGRRREETGAAQSDVGISCAIPPPARARTSETDLLFSTRTAAFSLFLRSFAGCAVVFFCSSGRSRTIAMIAAASCSSSAALLRRGARSSREDREPRRPVASESEPEELELLEFSCPPCSPSSGMLITRSV